MCQSPAPARTAGIFLWFFVLLLIFTGSAHLWHLFAFYSDTLAVFNAEADSEKYISMSDQLLREGSEYIFPLSQPPGFIFSLAALRAFFPDSLLAIKIALTICLILSALFTFLIGRKLFGFSSGLLAAALLFTFPAMQIYSQVAQYEVYTAFLLSLMFYLLLQATTSEKCSARLLSFGLSGAALAVCALTREVFLLALPLTLIWSYGTLRRSDKDYKGLSLVMFSGCFIVIVGAWICYQYSTYGVVVPISSKGPDNFVIGNNPHANGTFHLVLRPWIAPTGWDFIRSHPFEFLELVGRKFLMFFGIMKDGWNVPNGLSVLIHYLSLGAFNYETSLMMARAVLPLLFLVGLVALALQRALLRDVWIVPSMVFVSLPLYLLYISSFRFILPILPFMLLVAAYGSIHILKFIQERKRLYILCSVSLLYFTFVLFYTQSHVIPLTLHQEAEQLDGVSSENVTLPLEAEGIKRHVRRSTPEQGKRISVLFTDEYFPPGQFTLNVLANVAPTENEAPAFSVVIYRDSTRILCKKKFKARPQRTTFAKYSLTCSMKGSSKFPLSYFDAKPLRVVIRTLGRGMLDIDHISLQYT